MTRKRLYGLTYRGGLPAFFDDAGHLIKISGVLWQGMDLNILTLMPTACPEGIEDWIMMRVAQKYEDRKPTVDRQSNVIDRSFVDGLLDEHILIEVNP